jgi:hypothetical protein
MSPTSLSPTSLRQLTRFLVTPLAVLGVLAVPTTEHAETETFHRFEANAVAIYRAGTLPCDDGTTASLGFRVTGGHEEESENGVVTENHDFLTVFVSGIDCGGVFVSDTGTTEDVDFVWSPSLQTASVSGTVTTRRSGHLIAADLSWEATSPLEVDTNTNTFPGSVNHFVGRARDAIATGTVAFNGRQFVNGSTTEAIIETLEDTNLDVPVPPGTE